MNKSKQTVIVFFKESLCVFVKYSINLFAIVCLYVLILFAYFILSGYSLTKICLRSTSLYAPSTFNIIINSKSNILLTYFIIIFENCIFKSNGHTIGAVVIVFLRIDILVIPMSSRFNYALIYTCNFWCFLTFSISCLKLRKT